MKFHTLFYLSTLFNAANAGNYEQGDNYSTFTPTQGIISGATTQFTQTFGIVINPIVSSVALSSVTTQSDGQVVVSQISDGQIQATTSTAAAIVVTQIGDGQIQATTSTETTSTKTTAVQVVTQIGDGQIQATTLTTVTTTSSSSLSSSSSSTITTANIVTQIGDGQIQATTSVDSSSADASSSLEDENVTVVVTEIVKQYVTVAYSDPSSTVLSTSLSTTEEEITTYYTVTPTTTVYATLTSATLSILPATTVVVDKRDSEPIALFEKRDFASTCLTNTSLAMTLEDSILYDSKGRIGSIVANDQFQFDGPPPQTGAIYTAGWSIYDGKLSLGQSTTFYQCLSGNFYNLYDVSIGSQCTAVELEIVLLVEC